MAKDKADVTWSASEAIQVFHDNLYHLLLAPPAGPSRHTQGSGKSLTMVFYAGRLALDARLQNPTIVVLTDRNDLDDQLFGTFAHCHETLRQPPMQAESRAHPGSCSVSHQAESSSRPFRNFLQTQAINRKS
jgi:SWI2/SNF2 ATPase